jgi:hypothetical protein
MLMNASLYANIAANHVIKRSHWPFFLNLRPHAEEEDHVYFQSGVRCAKAL